MRNPTDFQVLRERFLFLPFLFGAVALVVSGSVAGDLPFDSAKICRLSVDGIPRSISIRQGADVWFGYELEKAVLFKVWKAPEGEPGLLVKSFKAQSSGATWFEEKADEGWQMKVEKEGEGFPLTVRYLGCTQNEKHFELRWEMSHPSGTIKLSERIPMTPAPNGARAYRELRVESLPAGASLVLPPAYLEAWELTNPDGKPVTSLSGPAWHQLSLP